MASGVLLLLVGEGTKLSHWLTLDAKRYRATVSFGRATDTLDALGKIVEEAAFDPAVLAPERVRIALEAEQSRALQVPPAYSAIKLEGRRAYRVTRAGGQPVLEARPVRLESASVLAIASDSVEVELAVSKGYYVRSFARDLGERLGVPAHLSKLTRLASGPFTLEEATCWPPPADVRLVPLGEAVRRAFPCIPLTPAGVARARQGKRLGSQDFAGDPTLPHASAREGSGVAAWVDDAGSLVALGEPREDGYAVVRGFQPE